MTENAPTPGEALLALAPALADALKAEGFGAFDITEKTDHTVRIRRGSDGLVVFLAPDHGFVGGTKRPWRLKATPIWPKDPAGGWIDPLSLGVRVRDVTCDPGRPIAALARDLGNRLIRPAAAALPAFHKVIAHRRNARDATAALAERLSRIAGGAPIRGTGSDDRWIDLHGPRDARDDRYAHAEVRICVGGSVEAKVRIGAHHAPALMACLAQICAAPADERQAALDLIPAPAQQEVA